MRAQKGLCRTLLLELSLANQKEVKTVREEEEGKEDVCPECREDPCICEEEDEE